MGVQKLFLPHSLLINTGLGVLAWIDGVKSAGPAMNSKVLAISGGSETDPEFVVITDVAPQLPVQTYDLSFLATCGFTGLPINSGSSKPGVICYGREQLSGALPTAIATARHVQAAVSDGVLVPVSIKGSHNQAAMLDLMLHAVLGTDGTSGVSPMVFSDSNAITAGAGATAKVYTASAVKFDANLISGITDLQVDFGLDVAVQGDTGDVYPSMCPIIRRTPKIMFTTKSVDLIATIGDGYSVTTFAAYFQKMQANGERVPKATTAHIGITATAGIITPGAANLQHQTAGTVAFTFHPAKNTNTIVIAINAAIPTT